MRTFLTSIVRRTAIAAMLAVGITSPIFAATALAPAPGSLAPVNKITPAFAAFRTVWEGLANYSETIVSHETTNDGKAVQDRTYRYTFVKPDAALIEITAGPGKGGGIAWHGGPTVHGHKGGLIAFVKLTLSKSDPRVTSLRGDQVEVASYGYELDRFLTVPGTLSEAPTPLGTAVTFTLATPDRTGITKEILVLSNATHLPVEHEAFVGDERVKLEKLSNVTLDAPNLTAAKLDI